MLHIYGRFKKIVFYFILRIKIIFLSKFTSDISIFHLLTIQTFSFHYRNEAKIGLQVADDMISPDELKKELYGQNQDFYNKSDALLMYTSGSTGKPKGEYIIIKVTRMELFFFF